MALTIITSIDQSLTTESIAQGADSQQGAQTAEATTKSGPATLIQDSFTPSNQHISSQSAAQEAGLFQVSRLSLAAATAGSQAVQSTQPPANQNTAPAQAKPVAISDTIASPTIPITGSNGPASAPASSDSAVQPPPPAKPPAQIPAFNQALSALGLSNNDIQELDQIATLVNVFSPAAFIHLIQQFQGLAQQSSQLSAGNASAASSANSAFQVRGVSLQLSGSQSSSSAGEAQNAGKGGQTQPALGGLQLQSVQITLANAAGQSVTVQTSR
jgi:hypothetical protein